MKKYLTLICFAFILCASYAQKNDTLLDYSMQLISQQEFKKAIPYLKTYNQHHPENLNAKLQLAFCLTQTGQLDKSINLYQDILSVRPGYHRAYYMLANLYMQKSQLEKALSFSNKALEFENNQPDYLLVKAQILRRQGDIKGACRYYKKAKRKGSSEAKYSLDKYCK